MAERVNFEDRYGLIQNVTSISNGVSADATTFNSATVNDTFIAGGIGVETSIYGIALNNHPTFNFGQNIIDTRKAIGTSYRHAGTGFEFQQGTRLPSATYEFDVTPWTIAPFLWTLFQSGSSQGGASAYVKTFVPYTEADMDFEAWLTLIRTLSDGSADSHVLGGMIANSIAFSAEEGTPLRAAVDMIGYNGVTDFDFDAQASLLNYSARAPLLWQNATITMDGTTVNLTGINFTITNSATPKFYDSQHPVKHILGDFGLEGTISVPWAQATEGGNEQITNFINGTDVALTVYWGATPAASSGDLSMVLNIRYTGAETTSEDEIATSLPFIGVYDGTNSPCTITLADGVDRGIA